MHNKTADQKITGLDTFHNTMQEIKDFLEFDCAEHCEYEILYNYSVLHTKFHISQIQTFYFQNMNKFIKFKHQNVSVTEILSRCYLLLDTASSFFCCVICANKFIIKNSLEMDLIASESDLIKFNNFINKRKCPDFIFKLDCNDKYIEAVNKGEITPCIYNLDSRSIVLNKNTFSYLINDNIDISSLMIYELNREEIQDLMIRLSTDAEFNSKCCKFIEEQGIINTTMQIIASLCDIKLKCKNVEYSNIYKLYCQSHFSDVYIPFSKIERIVDLSKQEAYFLYLSNTKNLEKDIPGIIEAIEDETDDYINIIDTNLANEKAIDFKLSISLPSLEIGSHHRTPERSIKADILDLAFKNDLYIPYSEKLYKYITELAQEDYFDKICKRHSKSLIKSNIELPESVLLSEMRIIIDFLDKTSCEFSLETIETDVLVSSFDGHVKGLKLDTDRTKLPMINFEEHAWLDSYSADAIMREYVNSDFVYCIKKLASNFLAEFEYSPVVCNFFNENHGKITENLLRAMVMCKLNIAVDSDTFSSLEIKELLEKSKYIFSLKNFILFSKVQKKYIDKFLNNLTDDQSTSIFNGILLKTPSSSFSVSFVQFMFKKYELSYIFPVLFHFIDNGQVEIIREIQKSLIVFLEDLFIDETHLALLATLYKKTISINDLQIKKNNDKILSSIVKTCKLLGKEAVLGNIKAK